MSTERGPEHDAHGVLCRGDHCPCWLEGCANGRAEFRADLLAILEEHAGTTFSALTRSKYPLRLPCSDDRMKAHEFAQLVTALADRIREESGHADDS